MGNRAVSEKAAARRLAGIMSNQRGIALISAILIMAVMAFLGAAIIFISSTDIRISRNVTRSTQALMVAEGGLSDGINHLRNNPSWGPQSLDTIAGGTWASQSNGTVPIASNSNGTYSLTVWDATGTAGRGNNSTRPGSERYTNLSGSDVLIESTGVVNGVTRRVALVVRPSISAFDYASFSDNQFEGVGTGNNPGGFNGKLYAGNNMQLQGNYNLSQAIASSPGKITPDCNSAVWTAGQCQQGSSVAAVTPPKLDFAYYQNQANFAGQQVFKVTPGVDAPSSCGANCTQWNITYQITTLGNTYTVRAPVTAQKVGSNYNHTVSWCSDPAAWNGLGNCPGGAAPSTFTFTSDKAESSKPFINAPQFNAYTAPTGAGYTSSIVNVFDATKHLEFLGPAAGQTTTVTATILVGTASNNAEPVGKIDFEGGPGSINLQPANGLAVVAETVEFKAKYSSLAVNVGTATDGAIIIATKEFEVESEKAGNTMNFNMNGTLVAGNGAGLGEFEIGGTSVSANFNYVRTRSLPAGWLDLGSVTVTRREWRELL